MNLDPNLIALASVAVTIVTQVLKKSSLPVTGANAKVVVIVLGVIVVLIPAYLNGALTQANAETLVTSILLVSATAIGVYEGIKQIWNAIASRIKK